MLWNYYLREMGRNIRRAPLSHAGALVTSTLLFLLFNLFWIGSRVADRYFAQVTAGLTMEVFFDDEIDDIAFVSRAADIERSGLVSQVSMLSKEQARDRLSAILGQDYLLDSAVNPLPRSIVIGFKADSLSLASLDKFATGISAWVGVRRVSFGREWLANAENNRRNVRRVFLAIMTATLAGAILNSALVAGLLIRSKAAYVGQLRLLGAGALQVGGPYVLEGMCSAGLAATASWGLILVAGARLEIPQMVEAMPESVAIFSMVASATLAGCGGAFFAVARSLRQSRR